MIQLPKWVIPSSFPSVYDTESATVIEQTAKLYGAMRELIEDYNKFVDGINEEIRTFTGSSNEEIANFKQSVEERLRCKFEDLNAQLSQIRLEMKQYTDTTMQRAFDVFGVTVKAAGENITLSDATNEKIRALSIYGKTTQQWEPVPDYPADLQSVGDAGSVTIHIADADGNQQQELTIKTPEGLPGIPVSEGGNYTDATGQEWICDEIDLERGVYIKRVANAFFDGTKAVEESVTSSGKFRYSIPIEKTATANSAGLCTHAKIGSTFTAVSESAAMCTNKKAYFYFEKYQTKSDFSKFVTEQYVAGNPISIQYELLEPEERPLTSAEMAAYKQLHTYQPDTEVTTDTGAGILLEYVAITQQYLENKIHDQAVLITTEKINEAIRNREIVVGLEYNEETESANIIVGGEV